MTYPIGHSTAAVTLANPWSMVPSLGNLEAYISAANRLPMLTLEEEQARVRADAWANVPTGAPTSTLPQVPPAL